MEEFTASLLVGLSKAEQVIVMALLHSHGRKQFGEIPGRNLRTLLDTTKEQMFLELEKLVQKNILKFSSTAIPDTVYLLAGKGCYIFNPNCQTWTPTAESNFYKVCRMLSYPFSKQSFQLLLTDLDLRKELVKSTEPKEKRITPYELFDVFCQWHQKTFGREYFPPNQTKDLQTLKKIIFDMSMENYSDETIIDFVKWSFLAKAREFKTAFIIGFLPLCLKDYLALHHGVKNTKYVTDEDGRLRIKT